MTCANGPMGCGFPLCGCEAPAPVNALGEPAPGRTDFTKWERANLERFARQAADENLILRRNNAGLHAAWRAVVNAPELSFQQRVEPWLLACFGPAIAADAIERNHRFLEEALELVQACGCSASEAHQLVDYTFGRPIGEKHQEVGGVMVTLAALCRAQGVDMHAAGEVELARIWTMMEKIRAKQVAKPKHSPLPEHTPGVKGANDAQA